MSTKKRFSISPDLASGIRNTIQSAASNHGQLHYDMMPLELIEPDPQNPRQLAITREEILQGLSSTAPDYHVKSKELEALQELAASIKQVGIRNAIEVYKEGQGYRIISGERRYLAAHLAGQTAVPARINPKPDEFKLRYTQLVENFHRQDLSLWEKYNNLLSIAEAYSNTHRTELTEKALQGLLGVSSVQAYRYFCLLKADKKIIQLIKLGKLNNLKIVQELVSMKDKEAREQVLTWVAQAKGEVATLANYKLLSSKKPKLKSSINLGKVYHADVARYLLESALVDERMQKHLPHFKQIDWNSPVAINQAFRKLLKVIEKELSAEEMA